MYIYTVFVVNSYGIDANDQCYCNSGNDFKSCCSGKDRVMTEKELMNYQSSLFKLVWSQNDIIGNKCLFSGCTKISIGSHSIQRNGPLRMIESDKQKPIHRFKRLFISGNAATSKATEQKNQLD
jgi:hypothetical protein